MLVKRDVHEDLGSADDKLDKAIQEVSIQNLLFEQNLIAAILAGGFAAILCTVFWALVTVITGLQSGLMAIGVGFFVGAAVRIAGKGITKVYGVIGAVLSITGCLFGNLFSICYFISASEDIGFMETLSLLDLLLIFRMLIETFHPFDILFYGLAIYVGYSQSFRRPEL